jgi:hypothetical protein
MQGTSKIILCDGCGQAAGPEHIARRLKRLENMTRYRPIHVQALFLGAVSPAKDAEHLYSAEGGFGGEGAALLRALGVNALDRGVDATLAEFQRRGFLLAHVLECAEENGGVAAKEAIRESLRRRIPATVTRIRRSFKPKRIVLMGANLGEFVPQFTASNFDAVLILRNGRPFHWSEIGEGVLMKELAAQLQPL